MKYTIGNMEQPSEQNTVLKRVNELIRSKYFTLAREALDRAIAQDPKSIPLRAKLVEVYSEIKDFQEVDNGRNGGFTYTDSRHIR